jgi:NADH-quinone oxidoreductase subunit L
MLDMLWLIPALPFAASIFLLVSGARLSRARVAMIGAGSVGLSAVVAVSVAVDFISAPAGNAYTQTLWTWMSVGSFSPAVSFYLDALSLIMMLVVTIVGFFILLYSYEFMAEEEGYSRFFGYMDLFVGSMLTLVLAGNLLLLYLGWEGVGLCSYLLIGFWYAEPENGHAARKAFIVTRVGDAAMAVGLFILFIDLGTLQIQELMHKASEQWPPGSSTAVLAAALLLGGAVGKSAQLPLQTWLPDAMAGPTPVSALIHAATMVTAGVYLVARMNTIFELAPIVQSAVALIGALTLVIAGFSALTQRDIKRVLAYSTMSQVGYMFLSLGVGAWSASIFHFMTHAFFKALLFLAAGVVIASLNDEHDMFRMGGLRKRLPVAFWTFLIGSASLAALPLVTAGFYSKDLILWSSWSSEKGSRWLWGAGAFGAFLTSLYTFRMVFLTFFGEEKTPPVGMPGISIRIPLVILAILSVIGGLPELPAFLGNVRLFSDFLGTVLPPLYMRKEDIGAELTLFFVTAGLQFAGIYLAYLFFLRNPESGERLMRAAPAAAVHRFWFSGWGFDRLYDLIFVRPFVLAARINKDDVVDLPYRGLAWYGMFFHDVLSRSQTGKIRRYAAGIAIGAVIVLGIAVFI